MKFENPNSRLPTNNLLRNKFKLKLKLKNEVNLRFETQMNVWFRPENEKKTKMRFTLIGSMLNNKRAKFAALCSIYLHLLLTGGHTPISPQIVGIVESCAIKALENKFKINQT